MIKLTKPRPLAFRLNAGLSFLLFTFLPLALYADNGPSNATKAASRSNNMGVAYMNQQFAEKALHAFQQAHQDDPQAVIPVVNEGIAYLYLRKLPEAEETLKAAVALDPKSLRGWYSLGITHMSGGNQDVALDDFHHALALDSQDPDIHYFIGSIDLGLKQYDGAISEFTTTLKDAPLHASAQFGLARALQREGKLDESREHLKRFQEITQSKIGTLMSSAYGEQGRYATVQDMLAPPAAPGEMIHVSFLPTSATSATARGETGNGGGACMIDLEGNGARDLVLMVPGDGLRAYNVGVSGKLAVLSNGSIGVAAKGDGVSCAVGDYDNDGLPDLAVALTDRVVLFHNLGHGKFANVTASVGIQPKNHPAGIMFVDYDHDGDLDLFVTGSAGDASSPSVLWRNNGNSTFTEWTQPTGLGGSGVTRGAVLSDLNNDRAVDLVVAGASGSPQLYFNQREGAFKQASLYANADLSAPRALAIADFNKDGWMDVAVTHEGAPGVTLWRNLEGKGFERVPLSLTGITAAWGLTTIDFDNDGWIDLAVIVETAKGTELRVLRNEGARGFVDVSSKLGLENVALPNARSVITADVDGDGAADLIVSRLGAEPVVLHNAGGNQNHSLRINLAGLADNKSAIGTKIEVFANGDWQKFEVTGASGYQSQGTMEVLAGLGQNQTADVVRLLWPTGVPQTSWIWQRTNLWHSKNWTGVAVPALSCLHGMAANTPSSQM